MDTDQPDSLQTYVNLTTHPYFNLDGMVNPTVLDHTIDMAGVKGVLELDDTQIPTGKVLDCTDFADQDIGFAQIHTKPDYFYQSHIHRLLQMDWNVLCDLAVWITFI
ncbi:hypothetical protein RTP6_001313 [Batrachochytrium dendrobatidis]